MENILTDDDNEIMAKNYTKLIGSTTKVYHLYYKFCRQIYDISLLLLFSFRCTHTDSS